MENFRLGVFVMHFLPIKAFIPTTCTARCRMKYINKVGQKKRQQKLKLVAVNLHPMLFTRSRVILSPALAQLFQKHSRDIFSGSNKC